jgi:hypothetical protein
MTEQRQQILRDGLMLFEPQNVAGRIKDVRDIFIYHQSLKQSPFNAETVNYLARLVRDALNAGSRFRVFDSIKVLRAIVLNGKGRRLPSPTVRLLFDIYQHLILKSRDEIQWSLSRLIKDQILAEAAVTWLVDHWSESVHLVNRLLLYPRQHQKITDWARSRYRAGDLPDRRSELIAILIPFDGISAFANEDPETLAWAIMRCSLARAAKIKHLSRLVTSLRAEALVTFATRLNAPIILRRALQATPAQAD